MVSKKFRFLFSFLVFGVFVLLPHFVLAADGDGFLTIETIMFGAPTGMFQYTIWSNERGATYVHVETSVDKPPPPPPDYLNASLLDFSGGDPRLKDSSGYASLFLPPGKYQIFQEFIGTGGGYEYTPYSFGTFCNDKEYQDGIEIISDKTTDREFVYRAEYGAASLYGVFQKIGLNIAIYSYTLLLVLGLFLYLVLDKAFPQEW